MAARSLADAPEIDFDPSSQADPHAYLKAMRAQTPIARTPMGIVIALRHRHFELVTSDAARQLETETKVMQGVTSGPIWDITTTGMLFANGEAHRRRRAPVQRTFAFKLMDAMRPKAAALAAELVEPRINQGPIDF